MILYSLIKYHIINKACLYLSFMSENHRYLIKEINELKKEKNAVILVHNYQKPEIYDVADFLGDSLELAKSAVGLKGIERIIFCGVDFMAESAAILNPDKKVYLPAINACCPMAGMVDSEQLEELQLQHPNAATVCYINTSAEVKALSDICCTSSNAVRIVESLSEEEIIFVPDKNLATYVSSQVPGKSIIPWEGYCYVHQRFNLSEVSLAKKLHPESEIIAHPECPLEVIDFSDHVCSTSGMIDYAKSSSANSFIILTEIGMTERLKIEVPNKEFLTPMKICTQMKRNSLELIRDSLLEERYRITVPEDIAVKARLSLERMLTA
jgi:quinolinate synthase